MAAIKKPTHVVRHKRLYLAVASKLTHIPQGSELALSAKQAKGLGRRVAKIGQALDLEKLDDSKEVAAKAKAEGIAEGRAEAKAEADAKAKADLDAKAKAEADAK